IQAQVGKPKMEVNIYQPDPAFAEEVRSYARDKVEWSLDTFDRYEREDRSNQVKEETVAHFAEAYPDSEKDVDSILYTLTKEIVRDKIINRHIRPDGRKQDEIRPIWCETGILPRTHGSAVFTRGQTQVMTIATLGCMGDGQTLDGIGEEDFKRYIHHYNMPPYSVGETRPVRSPGRREIGHGALAERALLPMIPSEEEFPYAIRLVSEVVSSNGSTSQASICASTMALMDAGVPIKKPVAGVAMGLIKDDANGNIAVLTDIQGLEDFLGDMDFKVAGTKDGITAIQMDIKIKGIDKEILTRALEQARQGRLFILNKMLETIPEPRKELSPYAPRILQFNIHPDKIREVIGSGGKTINGIIAETGVKIDIEDDGRVFIASPDMAAAEKAKKIIDSICHDIEVGEVFLGKVVNILPIGAQVELKPGKKGLVHISRLANHRVERVEDEVSVGDELLVRVIAVKPDGKIDLTRKDLLPDA
ncbi:MAG: polyribonucleotide nucleotidyltransferase, partial [Christensenellales bacterium]|nr:polyribonucleotide nucleotidyltransferase [Christensenellales bacterium]